MSSSCAPLDQYFSWALIPSPFERQSGIASDLKDVSGMSVYFRQMDAIPNVYAFMASS